MLPTVDRTRFFSAYRTTWGRLTESQVAGLEFLLGRLEADPHLTDLDQIAYVLATTKHETADTFQPIDERGGAAYFKRYDPGTRIGKRLGNTEPGDGARFHGRGYVQLTGRRNYREMSPHVGDAPLEEFPDSAREPEIAYEVMSAGMRLGLFTGKKLSDYIHGEHVDFKNARRIINGTDRADAIAALAVDFRHILDEATTTPPARGSAGDASAVTDHRTDPGTSVVAEDALSNGATVAERSGSGAAPGATDVTGPAPGATSTVSVETSGGPVNVAAPVATVPIAGGSKDDPPKVVTQSWSARVAALITGSGISLLSLWQAISANPSAAVIITLVIVGGLVGLAYLIRSTILDRERIKANKDPGSLNVV